MATERQIAANRANAKRSSGPRTAAGKFKSSRNSFRHGLSLPRDPAASETLETVTRTLAGDGASDEQRASAAEFSQAQLELLQIRKVRAELMAVINIGSRDPQELRRLAALDRYERVAHTKRRRAARNLSGQEGAFCQNEPNS
jgi:hypothetical protein